MASARQRSKPRIARGRLDRELATAALEKERLGQTPTRRERQALRRVEQRREEEQRWEFYGTIPKKHWCSMSGRQRKVLLDQARRYGVPLGGRTIDLSAFATWLHDFLDGPGRKVLVTDGEDPMTGENSPALERWREERYQLAQLKRREKEGGLMPRDEIHTMLGRVAGIIRGADQALERNHGPAAQKILHEALDQAERDLEKRMLA